MVECAMRWWSTPTAVLALAVASGCEAPARYTVLPMTPYDKDTAYRVDDSPSGFTLYLEQARYQRCGRGRRGSPAPGGCRGIFRALLVAFTRVGQCSQLMLQNSMEGRIIFAATTI